MNVHMNVHLFGKKDSPCCSSWALKKSAYDNSDLFSIDVIIAILKKFYMDDYLDSFDFPASAIDTIRNIISVLKHGGFHLTKIYLQRP